MSYGRGPTTGAAGGNRGYGGGSNPYDDGSQNQRGPGSDGDMEMSPYGQQTAASRADPNAVLNDCRDVEKAIQDIENTQLAKIRTLQYQVLQDTDSSAGSSAGSAQLDDLMTKTIRQYRALTDRVRAIKGRPDAGTAKNRPHIERVDRRLRAAINQFQVLEMDYRQKNKDQMARQYRIVRPDASDNEVRAAVEDPSGSVFSQALMQSDRRGQSRSVLRAVEDRQRDLEKIATSMEDLSQLFIDLDNAIIQQDVAVQQIEQQGEEIVDNIGKGNEEIAQAVVTAKGTRKKKWICMCICVLILVIIAIILAVYFTVINPIHPNNSSTTTTNNTPSTPHKRALLDAVDLASVPARHLSRIMRAHALPAAL